MTRGPVPSQGALRVLTLVVVLVAVCSFIWLSVRVLGLGTDVTTLQQTAIAQDTALREANRRLEDEGLPPVAVPETPAAGVDGVPGLTGDTGTDGTDGSDGATGATGSTGAIGPRGPRGFIGPVGPTGLAGKNGTNGGTGAAGPAGPTGDAGAPGPPGQAGSDGTPGKDGNNGVPGRGIESVACDPATQEFVVTYDDGTTQPVEGSDCVAGPVLFPAQP